MSLKINEDPVSTPASEWAEQTTSALGSSANELSSKPANSFSESTGANSTATTPGVNVPGAFPRSGSSRPSDSEPLTLPDVSQHVANARDYITSVDLSQHVETVRQYLPAREDVQATVVGVAQSVGQYLPDGVVDAAQELVGRGGHSTTPHDIDTNLRETAADRGGAGSEGPVDANATVFDTTSTHPASTPIVGLDSNNEPTSHSTHSTLADTQHAARVPLPPPTSSFAQPTVDVTEDTETGSPVVTVHPEAGADARPEPGPELESASAGGVNAEVFGAVGRRAPRSQSNFYDTVGDNHANVGPPDSLPAISNPQAYETGTTAPSAPTAPEKPISVVPMSGALSPPPPPPKDTTTTTTSSIPAQQDAETRSTSSDAAIPSMGSEDKLGGREPASRRLDDDEENVDETDKSQNDAGKQKKGASKLLGKMKEKLKTGHGQKA